MELQKTIRITIIKDEEQKIISDFMKTLKDDNGLSSNEIMDILRGIQLKQTKTEDYKFVIEYW